MKAFADAYTSAFRRYADFSGRTSVGGFWRFTAVNFAVFLVLGGLSSQSSALTIVYGAYVLALLVPTLSISIRRLHDTGRSGWFLLLWLIPIIGSIILIVFWVQASSGPNDYGQGAED